MFIIGKEIFKKEIRLKQDRFFFFPKYGKTIEITEVKQLVLLGSRTCVGFALCWLLKIKQLSFLFPIPCYILSAFKQLVKGS